MAKHHHQFTRVKLVVEGSGMFPIDMLRYAVAVPATETDAHSIEFHDEKRRITLHRFTPAEGTATLILTTIKLRFESYHWPVISIMPDPVL